MTYIVLLLILELVPAALAIAMLLHAWRWETRALRAERLGYDMQEHLAGLGCRVLVEVDSDGREQLRFAWPEVNDFVLDACPKRKEVNHGAIYARKV
jgi:hypothetical protein